MRISGAIIIAVVFCCFLVARGQVVQPSGTYDEVEDIKNLLKEKDRLKIDSKASKETSNLKNLLETAKSSSPTDFENLKILRGSKEPTKPVGAAHEVVSYVRNATLINNNAFTNPEYFGTDRELTKHSKILESETIWHTSDSANARFHEQVRLVKVEQFDDFDVDYDHDIEKWIAFRSNWKLHTRISMVGKTNDGIVLMKKTETGYRLMKELSFGAKPFTMAVFEMVVKERVGIVIVSIPNEIVWCQTNTDFTDIEEVWRWQIHKNIAFIKHYSHNGNDLVILMNNGASPSADIYEFRYEDKQFWIAQVIPLSTSSHNAAYLNLGDNVMLCIPQSHEVLVYAFESTMFERGRMVLQETISAPNLTTIKGFDVGGNSFLAIGGDNPRIMLYDGYGFTDTSIDGTAFTHALTWLPVVIHTHRDDLIVLVEHKITFDTHSSHVISALIWNGESFDVSPFIPCHDEDDDPAMGLSCILDPHRPQGLEGTTFIQKKDCIALVVPQKDAPSVLYKLYYEIAPAADPVIEELKDIEKTYEILAGMEEYQDTVLADAIQALHNAFDPESSTRINASWEIDYVYTPELYTKSEVSWNPIYFGGSYWRPYDENIDYDTLKEYVARTEYELDKMTESTFSRNSRSFNSPETRIPYHANGRFSGQYTRHSQNTTQKGFIRQRRELRLTGPIELESLLVDDLVVESINGIPVSELAFTDEDNISIKRLRVRGFLDLTNLFIEEGGTVNSIDVDKDLVHFSTPQSFKKLVFQQLTATQGAKVEMLNNEALGGTFRASVDDHNEHENEETEIHVKRLVVKEGDLNADEINGMPWKDVMKRITPRNLPMKFEMLDVKGSVIVDNTNVDITKLNNITFLDDLVFAGHNEKQIQITGRKKFVNGLVSQEVDCGIIDGIAPDSLISLSNPEFIVGNTQFDSLEVLHRLEVDGNIEGEHVSSVQDKLNLQQSRIINSDVAFENLQVFGPVKIKQNYNDISVDELFSSVIYTDSPKVAVDAYKKFDVAEFDEGIHIESGLLNDFDIKNVVTKSTDQELPIGATRGDVIFQKLQLDGLFDGIDVGEVIKNTVKLYETQDTGVELIFANDEPLPELQAQNLIIESTLNNIGIDEFVRIDLEEELQGKFTFHELLTDQCDIYGNVQTTDLINGVSLTEFEMHRLSVTRPQTIDYPIKVKKLVITGNLKNEKINSIETGTFTNNVVKSQSVRNLLFSGDIVIDNMHVAGNAGIKIVNGRDFNEIIENAVWLNKPNSLYGDLVFLSPVVVYGNLTAYGYVNGGVLNNFFKDLALKSQNYIKGAKVFENGFHVTGNIETESINGYGIGNFVLKKDRTTFTTPLTVKGYISCGDLYVNGYINNISMQYIKDTYHYDDETHFHIIKGDVAYHSNTKIDYLVANGSFNTIPSINYYINSLIRVDQDYNITGPKSFLSTTYFDSGFDVVVFNEEPFSDLMSQVILVNNADVITIKGLVHFKEPVYAPMVQVKSHLATHNIADCSPLEWSFNGLMTDRNENVMESFTMDAENFVCAELNTIHINGKPMDDIVMLEDPQNFEKVELRTKELHWKSPIRVGGTVNKLKLPILRENTLMNYGIGTSQHVATTSTSFQSLRVLQSLKIDQINGIPFDNIATITSNLQFHSPLEFKHLKTQTVDTEDFIAGINFNVWFDASLSSSKNNLVASPWSVENLYLTSDLTGSGVINDVDIDELQDRVDISKAEGTEALLSMSNEYRKICDDVKTMAEKTKEGVFFFKYFDHAFTLHENEPIYSAFRFKSRQYDKILVNSGCESSIYRWDAAKLDFDSIATIKTGYVKVAVAVEYSADDSYLVVLSDAQFDNRCQYRGLNIHKIENGVFTSYQHFTESPSIIDIYSNSKHPKTFYAISTDNKVKEYDIHLRQLREWLLPRSHGHFRFLPVGISEDIALSDGRHLIEIPPTKRVKRDYSPVYVFPVQYYTANPMDNWYEEEQVQEPEDEYQYDHHDEMVGIGHRFLNKPFIPPPTEEPTLQDPHEAVFVNNLRGMIGDLRAKIEILKYNLNIEPTTEAIHPPFYDRYRFRPRNYFRSNFEDSHEIDYDVPDPVDFDIPEPVDYDYYEQPIYYNFQRESHISADEEAPRVSENSYKPPDLESIHNSRFSDHMRSEAGKISEKIQNLNSMIVTPTTKSDEDADALENEKVEFDPLKYLKDLMEKLKQKIVKFKHGSEYNKDYIGTERLSEELHYLQLQLNKERTKEEEKLYISHVQGFLQKFDAKLAQLEGTESSADAQITNELRQRIAKYLSDNSTPSAIENVTPNRFVELQNRLAELTKQLNLLDSEINSEKQNFKSTQEMQEKQISLIGQVAKDLEIVNEKMSEADVNPNRGDQIEHEQEPVSETKSYLQSENDARFTGHLKEEVARWNTLANKVKDYVSPSKQMKNSSDPAFPAIIKDGERVEKGQNDSKSAVTTETLPTNVLPSKAMDQKPNLNRMERPLVVKEREPIVSIEMPPSSINSVHNSYLPEKGRGEVVVLKVGIHDEQRDLVAVIVESEKKSTIPGNYDTIKIYENIREGKIFQTIPCYQPSGLSTIHLRDETLLAFLEGKVGVRVYTYRGIQGFVLSTNFNLNKVATDMKAIHVPQTKDRHRKCDIHYLSVITGKEIQFYEAHTEPERGCGIHADLTCD